MDKQVESLTDEMQLTESLVGELCHKGKSLSHIQLKTLYKLTPGFFNQVEVHQKVSIDEFSSKVLGGQIQALDFKIATQREEFFLLLTVVDPVKPGVNWMNFQKFLKSTNSVGVSAPGGTNIVMFLISPKILLETGVLPALPLNMTSSFHNTWMYGLIRVRKNNIEELVKPLPDELKVNGSNYDILSATIKTEKPEEECKDYAASSQQTTEKRRESGEKMEKKESEKIDSDANDANKQTESLESRKKSVEEKQKNTTGEQSFDGKRGTDIILKKDDSKDSKEEPMEIDKKQSANIESQTKPTSDESGRQVKSILKKAKRDSNGNELNKTEKTNVHQNVKSTVTQKSAVDSAKLLGNHLEKTEDKNTLVVQKESVLSKVEYDKCENQVAYVSKRKEEYKTDDVQVPSSLTDIKNVEQFKTTDPYFQSVSIKTVQDIPENTKHATVPSLESQMQPIKKKLKLEDYKKLRAYNQKVDSLPSISLNSTDDAGKHDRRDSSYISNQTSSVPRDDKNNVPGFMVKKESDIKPQSRRDSGSRDPRIKSDAGVSTDSTRTPVSEQEVQTEISVSNTHIDIQSENRTAEGNQRSDTVYISKHDLRLMLQQLAQLKDALQQNSTWKNYAKCSDLLNSIEANMYSSVDVHGLDISTDNPKKRQEVKPSSTEIEKFERQWYGSCKVKHEKPSHVDSHYGRSFSLEADSSVGTDKAMSHATPTYVSAPFVSSLFYLQPETSSSPKPVGQKDASPEEGIAKEDNQGMFMAKAENDTITSQTQAKDGVPGLDNDNSKSITESNNSTPVLESNADILSTDVHSMSVTEQPAPEMKIKKEEPVEAKPDSIGDLNATNLAALVDKMLEERLKSMNILSLVKTSEEQQVDVKPKIISSNIKVPEFQNEFTSMDAVPSKEVAFMEASRLPAIIPLVPTSKGEGTTVSELFPSFCETLASSPRTLPTGQISPSDIVGKSIDQRKSSTDALMFPPEGRERNDTRVAESVSKLLSEYKYATSTGFAPAPVPPPQPVSAISLTDPAGQEHEGMPSETAVPKSYRLVSLHYGSPSTEPKTDRGRKHKKKHSKKRSHKSSERSSSNSSADGKRQKSKSKRVRSNSGSLSPSKVSKHKKRSSLSPSPQKRDKKRSNSREFSKDRDYRPIFERLGPRPHVQQNFPRRQTNRPRPAFRGPERSWNNRNTQRWGRDRDRGDRDDWGRGEDRVMYMEDDLEDTLVVHQTQGGKSNRKVDIDNRPHTGNRGHQMTSSEKRMMFQEWDNKKYVTHLINVAQKIAFRTPGYEAWRNKVNCCITELNRRLAETTDTIQERETALAEDKDMPFKISERLEESVIKFKEDSMYLTTLRAIYLYIHTKLRADDLMAKPLDAQTTQELAEMQDTLTEIQQTLASACEEDINRELLEVVLKMKAECEITLKDIREMSSSST